MKEGTLKRMVTPTPLPPSSELLSQVCVASPMEAVGRVHWNHEGNKRTQKFVISIRQRVFGVYVSALFM